MTTKKYLTTHSNPLKIILIDRNPDLCHSWGNYFTKQLQSTILNLSLDLINNEQFPALDCLVVSSDSFGSFSGGMSQAILNFFEPELKSRIKSHIIKYFDSAQPVGTSFLIKTNNPKVPYIAHTPTVPFPMDVSNSQNAFLAMTAVLKEITEHNKISSQKIRVIGCPGLGSGTGMISCDNVARQMAEAYRIYYVQTVQMSFSHGFMNHRNIQMYSKIKQITDEISNDEQSDNIPKFHHEAQNYLQVILGKLDSLLHKSKHTKNTNTSEDLLTLQTSAKLLSALIDDLKDYEELTQGQKIEPQDKIDIIKLTNDVLKQLQDKLKSKNITCTLNNLFKEHSSLKRICLGNKANLLRAFFNVIQNAIKFSPANTSITITISEDKKGNELTFNICDQGNGIPQKDWSSVFQPHFRLNTHVQGNGLGLAIAKEIIQSMDGTIGIVNSKMNAGTTFYIRLPIALEPLNSQS